MSNIATPVQRRHFSRADQLGRAVQWHNPAERWRKALTFVLPTVIVLGLLLAPQIGAIGILLFLGCGALFFLPLPLVDWQKFLPSIAFVCLFPLVALISVAWSDYPQLSLVQSIELFLTCCVGAAFASARHPIPLLLGIFAGYALYFLYSMAVGGTVLVGINQDTAFAGLNASKNYFADITVLTLTATLGAIAVAMNRRFRFSLILLIVASLLVVIEIGAVLASGSAGAMVTMAVPLVIFISVGLYAGASITFRRLIIASLLFLSVGMGTFAVTAGPQIRDEVLSAFNKDSTLTGRTYLWDRADDVMRERPWIGTGYGAYWVQGNQDAEGLWKYSGIVSRSGFSFHNTQVDVRVDLGWLGYGVFLLVLITGFGALLLRTFIAPAVEGTFWLALAGYVYSRQTFESVAPGSFNMTTILTIAALAHGILYLVGGKRQTVTRRRSKVPGQRVEASG